MTLSSTLRPAAYVWTEGKTDWQILKRAFQVLGFGLRIEFKELDSTMGAPQLRDKLLKGWDVGTTKVPHIFIFDRDIPDVLRDISGKDGGIKVWSDSIFSFAIPVPQHRKEENAICIELLFSDADIKTADERGRRLFLNSEFDLVKGTLKTDPTIRVSSKHDLKNKNMATGLKILDSEVYRLDTPIALSKSDFANNVTSARAPFDRLDFQHFARIADMIAECVDLCPTNADLFFGGFKQTEKHIRQLPEERQLLELYHGCYRLIKGAVLLYVGGTIKYALPQEELTAILGEFKDALSNAATLSLTRLNKLLKLCDRITEKKDAAGELVSIRRWLDESFQLGAVGWLVYVLGTLRLQLDELKREPGKKTKKKPKDVQKFYNARLTLRDILDEFIKAESAIKEIDEFEELSDEWKLNLVNCLPAIVTLKDHLSQLSSLTFRKRSLGRVYQGSFTIRCATYADGAVLEEEIIAEDQSVAAREKYELKLGFDANSWLDLYPFFVIEDNRLCAFEEHGSIVGFSYQSMLDTVGKIQQTSKKLSDEVFPGITKEGDSSQAFFWAEVAPTVNPDTGIKANIPIDPHEFVGYSPQRKQLREKILELTNHNGLVFGIGGVGKTALLIDVTKKIYEKNKPKSVYFKNIIWVTAKVDFFDPVKASKAHKKAQFDSLHSVLKLMLAFFDHPEMLDYDLETMKREVKRLLAEQSTLLILDNFETVTSENEQKKIIHFFETDVKRELRDKPNQFKFIITSRFELAGTELKSVPLHGLAKSDGLSLLQKLYKNHNPGANALTEEEVDDLLAATRGIPLVIRHSLAQILVWDQPARKVIDRLVKAESELEVVQFSFAEILKLLADKPESLETICLLQLTTMPLTLKQIAHVLERPEKDLAKSLEELVSYQIIQSENAGASSVFKINFEAQLMTVSTQWMKEYKAVRDKFTRNFTIDSFSLHSNEEVMIAESYRQLIKNNEPISAKALLDKARKQNANSVLFKFLHAEYMFEQQNDLHDARKLLEELHSEFPYDMKLAKLLLSINTRQSNYQAASQFAEMLSSLEDQSVILLLCEFYLQWAVSLEERSAQLNLDAYQRGELASQCMRQAGRAAEFAAKVKNRDHYYHYLAAYSNYLQSLPRSKKPERSYITNAIADIGRALFQVQRGSADYNKYEALEQLIKDAKRKTD